MRASEKARRTEVEQSERSKKLVQGGASLATNGVSSLLNKFVPAGIAALALTKINPKVGKFLKGIFSSGYTVDQGIDFIRQKFTGEEAQEQPKAPEGPQNLKEAERIVALNKFNAKKKEPTMQEREKERFNKQYGAVAPQQSQPQQAASQPQGNTDQALLAALEKILQM